MTAARKDRRAFESWRSSTAWLSTSTRARRRYRREARQHAVKCDDAGLAERAAVWRRRARNG